MTIDTTTEKAAGRPLAQEPAQLDTKTPATNGDHGQGSTADLIDLAGKVEDWDLDWNGDQAPTLDLDQVRAWITDAYPADFLDDAAVLQVAATDAWTGRRFRPGQVDDLLDYVAQLDRQGKAGIYLRATTMDPNAPGRGKAEDSVELVDLWSDLDLAGPGHKHDPAEHDGLTLPPDEDTARRIVADAGLPDPSVWIHSGGGLYARWLLDTPHDLTDPQDRQDAARIVGQLQDLLAASARTLGHHYGTQVRDLARVLRIPGTVNRKVTPGRACRIVEETGARFTLEELAQVIEENLARFPAAPTRAGSSTGKHKEKDDGAPVELASRHDHRFTRPDALEYVKREAGVPSRPATTATGRWWPTGGRRMRLGSGR